MDGDRTSSPRPLSRSHPPSMKTPCPSLRDRIHRSPARCGESDTTALIAAIGILLLLVLVGGGVWVFQNQRVAAVEAERDARQAERELAEALAREEAENEENADPRWTEGPLAVRAELDGETHDPGLPDPKRFDGRGRLRGQVNLTGGGPPSDGFHVSIGPAAGRLGSEGAESREMEVPPGENEFDFDDLPLGSYDVTVRTGGLQGRAKAVMLIRGSEEVYVSVGLVNTGFITGDVLDHRRDPVADLPVLLVSVASKVPLETRTDGAGHYRFDDVADGEYRLHFGGLHSPILDPVSLSFAAPRLSMPSTVLPETGQLTIQCTDEAGQSLVGIRVQGYGNEGGRIDVETDGDGRATVNYLPLGTYTILAREENVGQGRTKCHVYPGPNETCKLVLVPR